MDLLTSAGSHKHSYFCMLQLNLHPSQFHQSYLSKKSLKRTESILTAISKSFEFLHYVHIQSLIPSHTSTPIHSHTLPTSSSSTN